MGMWPVNGLHSQGHRFQLNNVSFLTFSKSSSIIHQLAHHSRHCHRPRFDKVTNPSRARRADARYTSRYSFFLFTLVVSIIFQTFPFAEENRIK